MKRRAATGRFEGGVAGTGTNIAPASLNIDASIARFEHTKIAFDSGDSSSSRSAIASPGLICPPDPPPAKMIVVGSTLSVFGWGSQTGRNVVNAQSKFQIQNQLAATRASAISASVSI